MITNEEIRSFVDYDKGLVSPHVFSSQEVYELELERLFGRCWLFLAHESQIPKPGDFFSTYMGADPVLVVRQQDGTVAAFLNFCRHRGMRVSRADEGNVKAFTCTYHGWSYDIAGRLANVPNLEDGYHNELNLPEWGLGKVPKIETYKGFVFGCFDETVPSLDEYLGDMKYYMDFYFDRREGGVELLGGVQKWKMQGNWKFAAEQFAGDAYHAQFSHVSDFSVLTPPEFMEKRKVGNTTQAEIGRQFSSPLGHGTGFNTKRGWGFSSIGGDPIIDEYEQSIMPEIEARLGADWAATSGSHCNAFPNMSWLNLPRTLHVWHPKGPNEFEAWCWVFVDKDAPEEVKQAIRWITASQFGPSGLAEQDDGENWALIGNNLSSRGPQIHKLPLNYTLALGRETSDQPFPGEVVPQLFSEVAQRNYYRRWVEFMTSDKWPASGESTREAARI